MAHGPEKITEKAGATRKARDDKGEVNHGESTTQARDDEEEAREKQ